MSQYLPKDGFSWDESDISVDKVWQMLGSLNESSNIRCVLEVDVIYLSTLHDSHNNLPYLPERIIPNGSKIKKLITSLNKKNKF